MEISEEMDSLALMLESIAEWRREKARDFPEDARNLEAAELLEKLAAECRNTEAEGEHFKAWSAFWETEGYRASEAASSCLKEIGFHSWPSDIEDLCRNFMAEAA